MCVCVSVQIESLPASSVSHYCCIITRRGRFSFRYTSASLPRRVFGAFRCAKNSHRIWNANREDWVGATERRPRVKNSRRNWNATETKCTRPAALGVCVGSVVTVLISFWLKCCFTSTATVGLLGTGAQDGHLHFHTPPGLCVDFEHPRFM